MWAGEINIHYLYSEVKCFFGALSSAHNAHGIEEGIKDVY